ncbi:MAG TPA: ExeM/NucH family extracellular endonuclease, partial [Woeseiaceae bacterium]|nr:ExeM/NucH family extracellular endonuclease [Woeseiaceae bacterium]
DGIALFDGSTVVQFLSYEGAFTAVGGPANGLTSTDIGVAESFDTPIGDSLQLVGTGSAYGDFTWAAPQPGTFGTVNTGQTFGDGTTVPMLVINEIDYDQPSTDTAEFVEILNAGATTADLAGWTLQLVNGSVGTVYAIIDLSGLSIAPGDYFVVCGNSATVANCDFDVTPDTDLVQNGSPDAVALLYDGAVMDAVSYEGDTIPPFTEGSGAGLEDSPAGTGSISRCPDGTDTNQNNVDLVFTTNITPGAENVCPSGALAVKIHEVQGNGAVSPLVGSTVRIEGIVVGDFQDGVGSNGDLNGFYVQEEDADADGDPLTSEGIFIFNGSSPSVDVLVGDLVAVEGVVSEFFGLTEITSFNGVTVISSGNPLPTVTSVNLPLASADSLEPYEGMYVTLPQPLVIAEYFNFDRFGEIVLTTERQFQPTATYEPGSPEAAQLAVDNSLSRITLDDGRGNQNPDPAIHPNGLEFNLENLFRGGDTVANITGVLDYAFDEYRVQPTQGANYVPANPRPEGPDAVGGTATVASFNVLNYFTTLDDGGPICGPTEDMFCRGADTEEEFTRQRDKIIAALLVIDADIVGLIEIENHPGDVPTADLVSGLNALMGAGTYDYVATGAIGTDAIRQAFIYKPASVSLLGDFAILDSSVDPRFLDDYNRPALAQTFEVNETGGVFTAVVNHLKSKGSNCNAIGDPDTGDGAGNCNLTRKAAAEALVDWLAVDPTGSGDGDFLIIGDLNSYDKEDPIDAILAGGYTDLVFEFNGEDAYSYVFDGQLGYLDHALSNAALTDEVTGTTIWHINADEPDLIDYDTSFKKDAQDAIYAPDAYRSSDHDPVIVGLDLCEATPPQFDTLTVTPEVLWPANHKYVDVSATVVASDNFDPSPFVTLVSVTSNEPDNGEDDGNTVDDIVIVDDYEFKLRAERSGIGTGRTYTITYEATDSCGNSAIGSAIVSVPLGRGK